MDGLPQRGPLPPGHQSLPDRLHSLHSSALRQSSPSSIDYGVLCEVMAGAPNFVICLLRRVGEKWASLQESRQPARSSAPPSGPRHRDRASPHAAPPPRSAPPSGPASVSASSLASVLRKPTDQQRRGREAHRAPFLAGSEFSFSLCRRAVTASSGTFSTSDPYST